MAKAMSEREEFRIEEVFESAVTIVKNLPKEGPIQPSNDLKLKLYAYYKQATCGPNTTSKPYIWQVVEYYKWDAWLKLGDMPREDAMYKYVQELKLVMETIPEGKTDPNETKKFEQVLGKKFYDYWFNQWKQKSSEQELTRSQHSGASLQPSTSSASYHQAQHDQEPGLRSNDTQSNSSAGSSMSMLEETQTAAEPDGYKTPNALEQVAVAGGQMNDQFALALLRLQHGLDETVLRVNKLEGLVKHALDGLNSLQNQTFPKRPISSAPSGKVGERTSVSNTRRGWIRFVKHLGTVHWFYLSYPILVYVFLRALERRRRDRSYPPW